MFSSSIISSISIKAGARLLLNNLAHVNKNYFSFAQACFSALCTLKASSDFGKALSNPYKKGCCYKAACLGYQILSFTTFGYLALLTTEGKCQMLANLVIFTHFALKNDQQGNDQMIKSAKQNIKSSDQASSTADELTEAIVGTSNRTEQNSDTKQAEEPSSTDATSEASMELSTNESDNLLIHVQRPRPVRQKRKHNHIAFHSATVHNNNVTQQES